MVNSLETFSMILGVHNSAVCIYLENEEDITNAEQRVQKTNYKWMNLWQVGHI